MFAVLALALWWGALMPRANPFDALMLIAVASVALGRLCFGSILYHLARGRIDFALRTLPWGRGA